MRASPRALRGCLHLVSGLFALLAAATCDAPLAYTRCRSDGDCPGDHRCAVDQGLCVPRATADAGRLDAAHLDAPPADHHGRDVTATDQLATDHQGTDLVLADGASADAAGEAGTVDGAATDAGAGEDATGDAGPQPPQVSILSAPGLFPGTSVSWQATAVDPDGADEALVVVWTLLETVAGVAIEDNTQTPLGPTFRVDREVYASGPADQVIPVRLVVTDAQGLSVDARADLRILDERGPFVDATSAWQGTGYDATDTSRHGYCGAPGHPCNNIQDGIDNLHDAQLADGLWSDVHEVRVASTGIYTIDSPILLGGNALSCGWNAGFTARRGATDRSRIEFTGSAGVVLQTSSAIDGCEIVGVAPTQPLGRVRAAVSAPGVGVVFKDSRAVGNGTVTAMTAWAIGLDVGAGGQPTFTLFEDAEVEGGTALTVALGLNVDNGTVQVSSSAFRGGTGMTAIGASLDLRTEDSAQRSRIEGSSFEGGTGGSIADAAAIGLAIRGGNPEILGGCDLRGGDRGKWVIGLHVGVSATGVHVADSQLLGLTQGEPTSAIGALVQSSLVSERCSYTGGNGATAAGIYAAAEVGRTFELTLSGDTLFGGARASAGVGLALGAGAAAVVDAASIRGTADISSAQYAYGLQVGAGASALLEASTIASGRGTTAATGVSTEADADPVELWQCTVVAGTSGLANAVFGVDHAGSQLLLTGGSVLAQNASDTVRALRSTTPASGVTLNGAQLVAENANGNAGTSVGVELLSGTLSVDNETTGIPTEISSGNAALESVGVHLEPGTTMSSGASHQIEGAIITSGRGSTSIALRLDTASPTTIAGSSLYAGTATGGRSVALWVNAGKSVAVDACDLRGGQAQTESAGLWIEGDCDDCLVQRCTAVGGDASADNSSGASIGMRLERRADQGNMPTFVHGNLVRAGKAARSRGVVVAGNGGADLRILGNTIDGGGQTDGDSTGVLLGDPLFGGSPTRVAVLVGNIIGAGQGATGHNIVENGTCNGASTFWAEPVSVVGGRNNNLWPPGASGLLLDFHMPDGGGCATSLTSIAAVNDVSPYKDNPGVADDRTRSEDPLLHADGVTLGASSPMADRAYDTPSWWQATGATPMPDFFGTPRPLGLRHDIGAHELK